MSADHVRVDVTAMPLDPPARFRALTEAAEHGGVETLWVCDSSLHARDVYVYLSLVATSSHRLKFGPNCTHPYTRHPGITANALATLQELSGGRARLALGVGDRPVTSWGTPRPRWRWCGRPWPPFAGSGAGRRWRRAARWSFAARA